MLLVDHHQPELGERHVLLDDRLRADDDVDLAGGDLLQQGGPLAGRQPAGQLARRTWLAASSRSSVSACCRARTSVGAISTAW